jgi:hypothetical protein
MFSLDNSHPPTIYYVRCGKYKQFLHFENEGRKKAGVQEFLASILLPDEKEGQSRTDKVRCYEIEPGELGAATVSLGYEKSSQHFKFNDQNVGTFR